VNSGQLVLPATPKASACIKLRPPFSSCFSDVSYHLVDWVRGYELDRAAGCIIERGAGGKTSCRAIVPCTACTKVGAWLPSVTESFENLCLGPAD
jgi:hypothetical protein